MAKNGFKILDSDIHIMEPPDLWERYNPPFNGRVRGFYEFTEDMRLEIDGKMMPTVLATAERRATKEMARTEVVYEKYAKGGWTSKLQLEAMDEESVDVAVIYPSRGLFGQAVDGMDPSLAAAIARAYNNWLYDFCQERTPNAFWPRAWCRPSTPGMPWPRPAGVSRNWGSEPCSCVPTW